MRRPTVDQSRRGTVGRACALTETRVGGTPPTPWTAPGDVVDVLRRVPRAFATLLRS